MKVDEEIDDIPLQPIDNPQKQPKDKKLVHSEDASKMINDFTSAYTTRLYEESIRVARRAGVDKEISTKHVTDAMNILIERKKTNKTKGVSGIAAGALLCVPLAPLTSLLSPNTSLSSLSSITMGQYIISSIFLVVSIILALYSVSD